MEEKNRAELKPCPFCGGSVSMGECKDNGRKYWFITRGRGRDKTRCRGRFFMMSEECSANAPLDVQHNLKKDLIEAWNRRIDDDSK